MYGIEENNPVDRKQNPHAIADPFVGQAHQSRLVDLLPVSREEPAPGSLPVDPAPEPLDVGNAKLQRERGAERDRQTIKRSRWNKTSASSLFMRLSTRSMN